MGVYIATFRLTGISPLLMNNPASMGGNTGPDELKAGKKKYIPAEEAASKLYKTKDGQFFVPTMAIRSSLLGACSFKKIGKVAAKQVISSGLFTTDLEAILVDPKSRKPITTYKINTARAVVQRAGVLRSRPEISPWSCDVDFELDDDFLAEASVVTDLLNVAGKTRGLLDWRPQKGGPYGRFSAELISKPLVKAAKRTKKTAVTA